MSAVVGPRLSVKNLQVCVEGPQAVDIIDAVSFSVESGEILGVVGESGSGKTTAGLALLGYARRGLRISGGEVVLDGRNLLTLPAKELRRLRGRTVSYVPQDPSAALNPALRVGAQIEELYRIHGDSSVDPEARTVEMLEAVNLPTSREYRRRYPHQLSGGQQQRVGLAMAFACRPALIVFDEPTTGLDVSTQRHVLDTVRRLCSDFGVSGVYVSHDLAVVGELVDQVAVMYAGRVVELGRADTVLQKPEHPYTQGLLRAIPAPDRAGALQGIAGQPPRPGRRPAGCSFEPRCNVSRPECALPPPVILSPSGSAVRCVRERHRDRVTTTTTHHSPVRLLHRKDEAPSAALLRVDGLGAGYHGHQVLTGVDLAVAREACVAVVGESGSGKTTLVRCVAGLHREVSGSMTFDGEQLQPGSRGRTKDQLRRAQVVFQNPYTSLNPRHSVEQLLVQPLRHLQGVSSREARVRAREALGEVSLGGKFIEKFPDELSGGERQRVAIARALIVQPDLLICDEITSALDVSVQAVVIELLRTLQAERHLSMLFVTHNLALVRSIAQEVVVLDRGSIVEHGSVDQVMDAPQHPCTINLLADAPKLRLGTAV